MATISFLDIPELQSRPSDRSLPLLRWLFSRGSHIFPQAGEIATIGFLYLTYDALPTNIRSITQLLRTTNNPKVTGYLLAAAFGISIIPFTRLVMVPNNFALMDKNQEQGGASRKAEAHLQGLSPAGWMANDMLPQEKTAHEASTNQDREVYRLLEKFSVQNAWRAGLLAASGIVGLLNALQN